MFEHKKINSGVTWCSKHFVGGKFYSYISMEMMANCPGCRNMLSSMVRKTKTNYYPITPLHGGNNHFDEDLLSVMEDFVKLTGKNVKFNL